MMQGTMARGSLCRALTRGQAGTFGETTSEQPPLTKMRTRKSVPPIVPQHRGNRHSQQTTNNKQQTTNNKQEGATSPRCTWPISRTLSSHPLVSKPSLLLSWMPCRPPHTPTPFQQIPHAFCNCTDHHLLEPLIAFLLDTMPTAGFAQVAWGTTTLGRTSCITSASAQTTLTRARWTSLCGAFGDALPPLGSKQIKSNHHGDVEH